MALLKFEKRQWHGFFDRLSKGLVGKQVEIEVTSLALSAQVEAEWLPLMASSTNRGRTSSKSLLRVSIT
jgi:hypothetical protein